jgi:uncharacterized membrane protein (DUF373 family)
MMAIYIEKFELWISRILTLMLALIVFLAVADLAWILVKDIITPPVLLLDVEELLDLFGFLLLILIGIELLETIKTHIQKRERRTEIILLVAIIAIARKVIILDLKVTPIASVLGLAAIIVALGITYYLIKLTHKTCDNNRADSTAG